MTTIYFIRHAQPDYSVHDDAIRPLTPEGTEDRKLVTDFLSNKHIQIVLSSPYKRAVDTVRDFADKNTLPIHIIDDFRERKVDSVWIEDFWDYVKKQWDDFSYKYSDGECLQEVRDRNIKALNKVLSYYKDKNIVIGTHGTALSQIIHHYDESYGYDDFMEMVDIMPWVVKMTFEDTQCIDIQKINLFKLNGGE